MFASSLFILWEIISCASHGFGALRSREACGPLLLRGHGFPHGFPIPSAFALCQPSVDGRNQGVRSALKALVGRQVSQLLRVKPVGLLHTTAPVRAGQLQSLWSLWPCRISQETTCRERLFHWRRLHRGDKPQGWICSFSSGRRSSQEGSVAGAEWDVLLAGGGIWETLENSLKRELISYILGGFNFWSCLKSALTLWTWVFFVAKASGVVLESRLSLLG